MVDQNLIDTLVVMSILLYNTLLTAVFLFRAFDFEQWERSMGLPFNLLLFPFTILWIINFLNGADLTRLGTSIAIIFFLAYDFWYRTLTQEKPRHHPEKWPRKLIIYFILLQVGSITLNGYGFVVSREVGLFVLATYFISLFAYAFYQYNYKKQQKALPS